MSADMYTHLGVLLYLALRASCWGDCKIILRETWVYLKIGEPQNGSGFLCPFSFRPTDPWRWCMLGSLLGGRRKSPNPPPQPQPCNNPHPMAQWPAGGGTKRLYCRGGAGLCSAARLWPAPGWGRAGATGFCHCLSFWTWSFLGLDQLSGKTQQVRVLCWPPSFYLSTIWRSCLVKGKQHAQKWYMCVPTRDLCFSQRKKTNHDKAPAGAYYVPIHFSRSISEAEEKLVRLRHIRLKSFCLI